MSTDDTGVTELLRRASDGLAPDVDRLVSGGIARGRSRRRRARIGTTVASLAVIGVVGGLAAVVPQLGGADDVRDPGVAADGGVVATAPPTEPPSGDPDVAPTADQLRPLIDRSDMAARLIAMTGASDVRTVTADGSGQDLARLFYATVDGAQVSFAIRWYNSPLVVEDGGEPLAPSHLCEPRSETGCSTLSDGSRLLREEMRPVGRNGAGDMLLERSLTLATYDGWQISVIARNSTGEKVGAVVADEPVMSMAEMEVVATSPDWFE